MNGHTQNCLKLSSRTERKGVLAPSEDGLPTSGLDFDFLVAASIAAAQC